MLDRAVPATSPTPPAEVLDSLGLGQRQTRKRVLRWLGGVALVAGLVAAVLVWRARAPGPEVTWETVAAERGDIAVTVDATGSLEPERTVIVGAEVSGKIASVEVEENAKVEEGQLLARFDLETFESELREAKASLAAARADIKRAQASRKDAERELERARKLHRSGIVSAEELDARETAASLASAELTRARAQRELAAARVDQIETKIEKAEVVAPITGVVLTRSVEPGSTVAATFQAPQLFTIAADLAKMTLELIIDEGDVGRIAVGQAASFRVDAWPEREFAATVEKLHLAPQVSGNVVTYVAELAVDNSEGLLRPGMTATATIAIGTQHDVLRVPIAALRFSPPPEDSRGFRFGPPPTKKTHASGSAVWVLRPGEDGQPTPTRVAIDAGASDGEWIAITDTELREGDEVLVGAEVEAER